MQRYELERSINGGPYNNYLKHQELYPGMEYSHL
jgi:hypothetical protein